MKIFNSNRKRSIRTQRFNKYLLYALGEIILVVIGIVIGLRLNKWNDTVIVEEKVKSYYSKISEEANFGYQLIEHNTKYADSLVTSLTSCLKSITEKKVDSTFVKNLTFLTDSEQQTFFFPTIDDFIAQGFLNNIKNIDLRENLTLLGYYRKQSDVDDANVQNFTDNLLKPKLLNKLNYIDIDHMNFENQFVKKLEFDNDYENNYEDLMNDLELWNLIVYRIDIEKNRILNNRSLMNILKRIHENTLESKP